MDFILSLITNQIFQYGAGSIGVVVVGWVLKRIPNDSIQKKVGRAFEKIGVICTLGLSKWKFSAPIWNKVVEPWVIDFLENTVSAAVQGFIRGLRSDNVQQIAQTP